MGGVSVPGAVSPEGRNAQKFADFDRRLRNVERGMVSFPQGAGTPTSAPGDGTGYVDSSATRLWLRVNGAWHYVALT